MRLHPYQMAFLYLAAFWAGVLLALLVAHVQAPAPEYTPFQSPL